ncbi:hypothetical protein Alsa3_CDS0131 [Staphylococcus phage Alsa_3]|nr:hypothetical protein Alsa3_CDS0131 [Staphylococcus phage Alsa_3]WNM51256.1 hypothetical protein Alsa4_CDS0126 [Staphylococcus phage Alsa_4]
MEITETKELEKLTKTELIKRLQKVEEYTDAIEPYVRMYQNQEKEIRRLKVFNNKVKDIVLYQTDLTLFEIVSEIRELLGDTHA